MSAKLSRRELAALALAGAGAAQVTAQTEPTDEAVAKQRIQSNAETLDRFELPMSTEPAFQFKA
jgi:hypothetical protein